MILVQHAHSPERSGAPLPMDLARSIQTEFADIELRDATWTRRRFIANGLVPMLLISALARAPTSTGASQTSAVCRTHTNPPNAAQSGTTNRVQVARLTTPVYLNGHGPYRFLVDTGALRSVLATEIAVRLALPLCPQVLLQGIILARKTPEVKVNRLGAGSVTCADLRLPVLPRAMLEADGYLGLDVLDGHRVVFDFRTNTLRIEQSQGFLSALWLRRDQIRIRAEGESGRLRSTDCYADGFRTTAFVDSGAEVSVCNSSLYALLQQGKSPPVPLTTVQLYGITGGSIVGRVIMVDTIQLPGITLTEAPAVIADLPVFALWGLSHTPAILIGMNCLRAFSSVTIDYGRKALLFQARALQRVP